VTITPTSIGLSEPDLQSSRRSPDGCSQAGSSIDPSVHSLDTSPADADLRMPPVASLFLMLSTVMLVGMNFTINVTTAEDYASRLDAENLKGLMIGVMPLCNLLTLGLLPRMLKVLTIKPVLLMMAVGAVFANVLYSLAGLTHFKWTLIVSRCMMGVFGRASLPNIYISQTVGIKRRSEAYFYYSAMNILGYALGPFAAAILEYFVKSIHVHNLVLDSDTAPGWAMAVLYLLFIVLVAAVFEDLPLEATCPKAGGAPTVTDRAAASLGSILACCVSLWNVCMPAAILSIIEVYTGAVLGQHYWGWSISASSLFLASLMLVSGIINMLMGQLSKKLIRSDRAGTIGCILLGCAACGMIYNFPLRAISAKASLCGIGFVFILTLASLIRSFGMALSTKLVPGYLQGRMNTLVVVAMVVGRGGGSVIRADLDPDSFFVTITSLFAVTLFMNFGAYRCMKPCEKAE